MNYLFHLLTLVALYVMLSTSLNLLVGYGGMVSVAHAAFYGIGAYVTGILTVKLGWSFFAAFPCAVIVAMAMAVVVAMPSLKLRGEYFFLATLAFQNILFTVVYNWVPVTRGPYGIAGIPRPVLFGLRVDLTPSYAVFAIALAAVCVLVLAVLCRSPFGRALRCIREDEVVAAALGKNPRQLKITAFVVSAAAAAGAGCLYAAYVSYIDPPSFGFETSVLILTMVIVGGAGNLVGPMVGAVLMVALPELLRTVRIPGAIGPYLTQVVYGLLLVLLMRFRPKGLVGEYRFD